jgi:CubicO group peptidase (beta-lactamase class C family)
MLRRRDLLIGSGIAALPLACRAASATPPVIQDSIGQSDAGVLYHYDESYKYSGVMQGFPPPRNRRVTIDNFFDSQENLRWTHQHMTELYTAQRIRHGAGPITILPRRKDDERISTIRVPDKNSSSLTVGELLKTGETDAFLVLHDGTIVTEQYFHGMRPDSQHYLWSASKSISACVVANLLASSQLSEESPVTGYIPELKESGFEGATIRHLLDMQSGVSLPIDLTNPEYNWTHPRFRRADHVSARFMRAIGLFRKLPGEPVDLGEYDFLPTLTGTGEHGKRFYYKDPDSRALAWACEKVTGKPFSQLLSECVWTRLGAEHDSFIRCDVAGVGYSAHGITVTLRDFARWGQMLLEGGVFGGERVVPRAFLIDILENCDPGKFTTKSFPIIPWMHAYRNQFWVPKDDPGAFLAGGAFGQTCYVNTKYGTVIVKFSTQKDGLDNIGGLELKAFREISRALAA